MNKSILRGAQGYLSKKAGSFSGVPQRTVQAWTEAGLLTPGIADTQGTGSRRLYSVLDVIQIGVLKALARERLSHGLMNIVAAQFKDRKRILQHFGEEETFLIIRLGRDSLRKFGEPDVSFCSFSGNGDFDSERWVTLTRAADSDKVLIINITRIAERILQQL